MRRKRNLGRLLGFVTILGCAALAYRADTLSHHEAQQSPRRPPVETVSLPVRVGVEFKATELHDEVAHEAAVVLEEVTASERHSGCGSRGGPGGRNANGKCRSWREAAAIHHRRKVARR
jgi:hypothetical protein